MRNLKFIFILSVAVQFASAQSELTKYVNPFVGTGGHGHTYPGTTAPFGMVQLSPDTRTDGSWDGCSGYHHTDSVIYGFTHTHLSGTGCSDYGDILLMPVYNKVSFDPKNYGSSFLHESEKASPGYYAVHLDDDDIDVELTATTRTGFHKYTFHKDGNVYFILDLKHRDKLISSTIKSYDRKSADVYRQSEAWAKDQRVFAHIEFSKEVTDEENLENKNAWFLFNVKKGDVLYVKVSLSGVDEEGAKNNMTVELPGWDFEKTRQETKGAWNKELSKIEINTTDIEKLKVFYTALYHCMLQPNIYIDADGRYRGRDMQIHNTDGFDYYTVFSLWDTFRAWHPLMTLIDRKRTLDFIKTFLKQYDQGGLLPVWELSSNETECMIGYHAVSVIADAAAKGIDGFDKEKALTAMKKSAEAADRYGLNAYMNRGVITMDDEHESVSKTLEYAYDDWCIAQLAKEVNDSAAYSTYIQRAQYWKNAYDPQSGFMRPKKNGNWLSPFDAREVNNNFTEANAWQYTFFVPQDISGLISAMGNKEKFERKLDDLFATDTKTTGREQADITGLIGQYAHGNEPSHHMAYLYNYIGKPWKTQKKLHQIIHQMYSPKADGLIGNEDCGQMSAWYVLSVTGIYQVTPGSDIFVIGAPLFAETKINLENGKQFLVKSENCADTNFYIQSASLNGKLLNCSYLHYDEVMNGGTLTFVMGNKPNKQWAANAGDCPVSEINEHKIIVAPVIKSASKTFKGKTTIELQASDDKVKLFYLINEPGKKAAPLPYTSPFEIENSCSIFAYAENSAGEKSHMAKAVFYRFAHPEWKIKINATYNPQYTAGGDEGIIDGIRGEINWRKGEWQGYQSQNFECVVDLGSEKNISTCSAGFLQDTRSWIIFPKKVEFSFSKDGKKFSDTLVVENNIAAEDYTVQTKDFSLAVKRFIAARYVKVKAINFGKLPEWHQGHPFDGDAFIFIDEVSIQ